MRQRLRLHCWAILHAVLSIFAKLLALVVGVGFILLFAALVNRRECDWFTNKHKVILMV